MSMFGFFSDIGNYSERVVARFESGAVTVDTARVSDGEQPYETGVKDPAYHDAWVIVEAYDTKWEAQAGHDRWVELLTSDNPPLTLTDCKNAAISELIGDELIYTRRTNV